MPQPKTSAKPLCWLATIVLLASSTIDATAAEVTIGDRVLKIPDGFTIEQVAAAPLVERPIAVSRDELGRLYVTDSAGMSDRADKQLAAKPHRIRRLEDRDGDGRYDTCSVFADKMMFPEGCLWHEGSLYVAAPPQIWKLTDVDGDGVAEQREVWFDGTTLTGCANDLHGPYLGHDGWLYWCKGAFAEQRHTLGNGKEFVTRASHIFRARPDGSGLEPVLTGGMDNPVNVAFLSTGERILSCTFFQQPAAGMRDGLIHAIYGGVYGKKHDPIYAHKMTGDVMPVLSHQGAAAPCGLIAGSEQLFGGGHLDNLFACYFNLHKVVRHILEPNGPTYKARDMDLVACDHPDFHPTDVFEDADGSLLIVDTGGWYKMCCPTSQLAKPDVLGSIYRLRKVGQPQIDDPLGLKLAWDKLNEEALARLLGDSRLFVQRRATAELRKRGDAAAHALAQVIRLQQDSATRRRTVWASASLDVPKARDVARLALDDRDPSVAQVAAHVAGLRRDQQAIAPLLKGLALSDAAVSRAAVEALGRLGDPLLVPSLFAAVKQLGPFSPGASGAPIDDAVRVSEHALIYALIEIGNAAAIKSAMTSAQPQGRRAALVALDQIEGEHLNSRDVIALLDDKNPILKRTAAWIVSHRPQWGNELVDYFRQRLATPPSDVDVQAELTTQLAQLAKSPAIQGLITETLRDARQREARLIVLRAMSEAGFTVVPSPWLDELAPLLSTNDPLLLQQGVAVARQLPQPKGGHAALRQALFEVGRRSGVPLSVRLEALVVLGALGQLEPALFSDLLAHIGPDESLDVRSSAATVLGKAALSVEQQQALLEQLKEVGPLELPKLLGAFERHATEPLGMKLFDTLGQSVGVRGLRVDLIRPLLAKYPASVQESGQRLIALLNASAAQQAAQLEALLAALPPGDANRGHVVFTNKKIACMQCHTIGYHGGKLGPDLTNIGKVRNDRDLLEAIIFPSASFVRSYESVLVAMDDGRTFTGIVVKETSTELVLATGPQQFQPLLRSEIEEMQPGNVSLMPQGIDKILNPQEIADLIAFLKNAPK